MQVPRREGDWNAVHLSACLPGCLRSCSAEYHCSAFSGSNVLHWFGALSLFTTHSCVSAGGRNAELPASLSSQTVSGISGMVTLHQRDRKRERKRHIEIQRKKNYAQGRGKEGGWEGCSPAHSYVRSLCKGGRLQERQQQAFGQWL